MGQDGGGAGQDSERELAPGRRRAALGHEPAHGESAPHAREPGARARARSASA